MPDLRVFSIGVKTTMKKKKLLVVSYNFTIQKKSNFLNKILISANIE